MKTEQELINKLDKLIEEKELLIKNQNYEQAAFIRDKIRTYTNQLEEIMNSPIFCNENQLSEKIKKDIIPLFLNMKKEEIEKIYEHFKNTFKVSKEERQKIEWKYLLNPASKVYTEKYKCIKPKSISHLGVDIPCWFNLQGNNNIMVIGLDPLRGHEYENDKVWFGIPYALNCSEFRDSFKHTKKYFNFINELAKKDGVYITDASKVFYREREKDNYDKRSTHSKEFWEQKIHFKILKKEIEIVKPKLIITLGSTTAHMLSGKRIKFTEKIDPYLTTYNENNEETIALGEIPLLCLSHLSNANNGGINNFLKANGKPSGSADIQVKSYIELVNEKMSLLS